MCWHKFVAARFHHLASPCNLLHYAYRIQNNNQLAERSIARNVIVLRKLKHRSHYYLLRLAKVMMAI